MGRALFGLGVLGLLTTATFMGLGVMHDILGQIGAQDVLWQHYWGYAFVSVLALCGAIVSGLWDGLEGN